MIERSLEKELKTLLSENKLVVIRGAQFTGRKTLLKKCVNWDENLTLVLDFKSKKTRKKIATLSDFHTAIAGYSFLVLEEAQFHASLQELVDAALESEHIENLVIISSFDLPFNELLQDVISFNGLELQLSPLSYAEVAQANGLGSEEKMVEERLIFGYYPEIVSNPEVAEVTLIQLLDQTILQNLSANERINKGEALLKLLRHLAWNIGKVVSYNELGEKSGLDNETCERYIHLLEKADILFQLSSYHTDQRYELKKSHIVYFTDNGIRNALIRSFQPFEYRNDAHELWKNWVLSERRKANKLAKREVQTYFWLTHTKQEMDYLEFSENKQVAYKISWEKKKNLKFPSSFSLTYPNIKTSGINRSTFWTFLLSK